jgi:hypothetical protein
MSRPPRSARPPRRLLAAWVALCVLLSGIAPGVSRALAVSALPSPHDLCVAGDPGRPALPPGHHGGGADETACPLCGIHGATHAAPPPTVAASGPVAAPGVVSARVDGPRAARSGWIAAAPRGPPLASRLA